MCPFLRRPPRSPLYHPQVQKLKHSRDKLLEEIDSQWEEMDRMASDNRAVSEELGQQKRLAAAWEAQAQVRSHVDDCLQV